MKKIISVLLALVMTCSMAVVAVAACPGEKVEIANGYAKTEWKIKDTDFTKGPFCGAHMVEEVKIDKDGKVMLVIKEGLTMDEEKEIYGEITLVHKTEKITNAEGKQVAKTEVISVHEFVNNKIEDIYGSKKADDATDITALMKEDTLIVMDEDGGYVYFEEDVLTGIVKMDKNEKVQVYVDLINEDTQDAIDAVLKDFKGITEFYNFVGTGFKNDIVFIYEADEEDPHFFYQWDGKQFVALDVEFDNDEDVMAYVWSGNLNGVIMVADAQLVAAATTPATKNPDTGATDMVGVASALAVVSLVAAGAVSLKK